MERASTTTVADGTLGAEAAGGLSAEEAARRLAERGPLPEPTTSRSYRSIFVANTFTVFNLILASFGAATILFGDPRDALFLGVLVANATIGVGQEVRAKLALDKLAALVAPHANVIRDGREVEVPVNDVVVGDLVRISSGDQVVADGEVRWASGLALDEALLTGESEPVRRAPDEAVFAGTFAIEGEALVEATAVGPDSRAARLTETARAFRHPRSPLERAMDRLLIILVAVMVPLAVALGVSLAVRDIEREQLVETLTAAVVNVVPEGLILLVSLTAAVSAIKMARRGVLAQQLNAIESLASVDFICTDKTGTLTEPHLRLLELVPADGVAVEDLGAAAGRYAAATHTRNDTLEAIYRAHLDGGMAGAGPGADAGAAAAEGAGHAPGSGEEPSAQVPFSSRRRWGALEIEGERLVLGAPEVLLTAAGVDGELAARAEAAAEQGRRVLALAAASGKLPEAGPDAPMPEGIEPLGLIVLAERLRPDADRTVAFFAEEDVQLKVLSGDAPATVGAIARDAGIPATHEALDGTALPEGDEELHQAVTGAAAIGRISPEDKARVVRALSREGAYVAMVGDGVNDVPALKDARLAIAQGTGTQMARSVSDLVLVRGEFSEVPPMVAEGRQILRNIQRVSRLFITKAIFTAFLLVAVGITSGVFPLLPRQFTLVSTLTIGIPAFFLALAPSHGPWRPDGFLRSVARFSGPAGVALGLGILSAYLAARYGFDLSLEEARTVSAATVVTGGLAVVIALEDEPGMRRLAVIGLCAAMAAGFVLACAIPFVREFFDLAVATTPMLAAWALGAAVTLTLFLAALRLVARLERGREAAT